MIFDYSDGDFIMPMDDDMGMDSDGNLLMRMSDDCSMDMESGDLHFTSPWKRNTDDSDDDSDDDFFGLGKLFGRLW